MWRRRLPERQEVAGRIIVVRCSRRFGLRSTVLSARPCRVTKEPNRTNDSASWLSSHCAAQYRSPGVAAGGPSGPRERRWLEGSASVASGAASRGSPLPISSPLRSSFAPTAHWRGSASRTSPWATSPGRCSSTPAERLRHGAHAQTVSVVGLSERVEACSVAVTAVSAARQGTEPVLQRQAGERAGTRRAEARMPVATAAVHEGARTPTHTPPLRDQSREGGQQRCAGSQSPRRQAPRRRKRPAGSPVPRSPPFAATRRGRWRSWRLRAQRSCSE